MSENVNNNAKKSGGRNNYRGRRHGGGKNNYGDKNNGDKNNGEKNSGEKNNEKSRKNKDGESTGANSGKPLQGRKYGKGKPDGQSQKKYRGDRDNRDNRDKDKRPPKTDKGMKHQVKAEETLDDIRADNARITKEIYLEIADIKNIKIG